MLTGDLLRFTRRKGRVLPRLVNPADAALLERAAALIAVVEAAVPPATQGAAAVRAGSHAAAQAPAGRRRGELERTLDQLAPAGPEHQVERGLAKLLLDRCTFETRAMADPAALRAALFDRSAAAWRTRPLAELPQWRAGALREAGAALGLSQAEAEETLYADLEANQALAAFAALSPERLLLRYNVALVQGLLLRADAVEVRAPWPAPARLRQLFRWLKFFGLLFEAQRVANPESDPAAHRAADGDAGRDAGREARGAGEPRGGDSALRLAVDGPLSVLEHASRYGVNLAQFAAALLLWPGPWTLAARVRVGKRAQAAALELEPHPWLKSPLPDQGAWVPEAVRDFVAAFNAQPGPWRAAPAERVVPLAGNAYLIPDFEFAAADGRRVLLEHVLYPAPERIARLLERARQAGAEGRAPAHPPAGDAPPFQAYWIACKRAVGLPEDPRLLAYRRTLLASQVRAKLEAEA